MDHGAVQTHGQIKQSPTQERFPDGVWPVIYSTFDENRRADPSQTEAQVQYYYEAGCAGVFTVSQTGEMYSLSEQERILFARRAVQAANGQLSVVACGNFGPDLPSQIGAVRRMADTGLDAVILNLATIPWNDDEDHPDDLLEAIMTIAEQVYTPLGVYECPVPRHRLLRPADIAVMAESGRFFFMKETSRNRAVFSEKVQNAAGSGFKMFQANLRVFLEPWVTGMAGFSGIISNVLPRTCVKLANLGEHNTAYREQVRDEMLRIQEQLFSRHYPSSGKYLLSLEGLPVKPYSRITDGLTAEDRTALDGVHAAIRRLEDAATN